MKNRVFHIFSNSYLVFSVAVLLREGGARRALLVGVAVVSDLVRARVVPSAGASAGRGDGAAVDRRVSHLGPAVAAQLLERDVGAEGAVAAVAVVLASGKEINIILRQLFPCD